MSDLAYRLKVFRQIGLAKPQLPHRLANAGYQLVKWGPGFPSAVAAAAARFPTRSRSSMTWARSPGPSCATRSTSSAMP